MAKEVKKRPKKASASSGNALKLKTKPAKAKTKKFNKTRKPLPSSFRLTVQTLKTIKGNWKTLAGIVLVYLLLNLVFASGLSNASAAFSNIKTNLETNSNYGLWHAAGGFVTLVASSGSNGSSTSSALQSVLFVFDSLVIIWALRHIMSGQEITVKQAYYKSMTPLVPFLLVLGVILLELLPISIGALAIAAIINSVIPNVAVATYSSTIVFLLLAAWSIYMVCGSIFGLYIVTLPDMQPRQALRSAKDLVTSRRLLVIRKILFLPLIVFIFMGLIVVPLILYVRFLVPAAFFVLSMSAILFVHTYLYGLYRELIE